MKIFFAIVSLFLISCSKNNSPSSAPGTAVEKANLGPCEDDALTKFKWDWCDTNMISGSKVDDVCYGKVTHTDIIMFAVQLKMKSDEHQCFFSLGGPWEDLTYADCHRAIERTYSTTYGDEKKVKFKECINRDGVRYRIDGLSLEGESFSSVKP